MRGRPNCVWPMILWPLICDRMASNTLMLYKYMTNPSTHSLPPLTSRTQRTPFWESRSHECFLLTHPVMNLPLSSPSLTPHAPLPPLPSLPLSDRRWRGRSTRCMRGEAMPEQLRHEGASCSSPADHGARRLLHSSPRSLPNVCLER
jgi:hypothetical protein